MTFNTDSQVLRDLQTNERKIDLQLVGLDSNAFNLMGTFRKQALREGWTKEEIEAVLNECRSGDHNHLLVTLMEFCDPKDDDDEYDDTDDDYDEEARY